MSTATLATPKTGKNTGTKFNSLKNGSIISETQYYTVQKIVGNDAQLRTDTGEDIIVNRDYVDKCVNLADYYTSEEVKSRTEITQLFLQNPYTAMAVNFNKKVDEKDVANEIEEAYQNSTPKEATTKMKAALKKALQGEERTMLGRHHGHQDEFGRISFIDMEKDKGTNATYDARLRLVDPRTINWLIVKDVKYKVK